MGLPSSRSQDSCWSSSHHHHRKERFREKEKSKGQRGLFPVKRAPLKTCPYYYEPPLSFKQSCGCSLLEAHNAAPNKIQGRRGEGRVDIHEYGSTVVKIVKYLHTDDKWPLPQASLPMSLLVALTPPLSPYDLATGGSMPSPAEDLKNPGSALGRHLR